MRAILASADAYGVFLLVLGIVITLAMVVGLYFLSRIMPKGVVFGIAIALYVVARMIPADNVTREVHAIAGTLQLAGVVGVILGLIDLFKGKKREKPVPIPPRVIAPVQVNRDTLGRLDDLKAQVDGGLFEVEAIRHDSQGGTWELPFRTGGVPSEFPHLLKVTSVMRQVIRGLPGVRVYRIGNVVVDLIAGTVAITGRTPIEIVLHVNPDFEISVA
jgi:hypothetical protein